MKFLLTSLDRPRAIAKAARRELGSRGIDLKLSASQELAARMLGYRDWFELTKSLADKPDADDDFSPDDTVARRLSHQVNALVGAGLAPTEAAAAAAAIHATNFVPLPPLDWVETDGRHDLSVGRQFYRIVAESERTDDERDKLFGLSPRVDGYVMLHDWGINRHHAWQDRAYGTNPDELKAELRMEFVERASAERQEQAMGRIQVPEAELGAYAVDGEPPLSAEIVADGIVKMGLDGDTFFRLRPDVNDRLHPVVRLEPLDDGFAWYDYERSQFVVLELPEHFTREERRYARKLLEGTRGWEAVCELRERPEPPTPSELALAKRGYSTMKTEYHEVEVGEPDARGRRLIRAVSGTTYCVPHDYDPSEGQAVKTFLVDGKAWDDYQRGWMDNIGKPFDFELYPVAEDHGFEPLGGPGSKREARSADMDAAGPPSLH